MTTLLAVAAFSQDAVETAFRAHDRNGDGFVTLEEARAFYAPASVAPITRHADIPYARIEGVDPKLLSLDVYAPADAKHAPVMVYVHGGGWKRGDKRAVGQEAGFFTGRGWVFVSINYRLLPRGRHPANARDVARALAWVYSHVARQGGDPERLFLMGHSAGCHLAALVATDGRHLEQAGQSLAILKGVIALDTNAYDLAALMQTDAARFYGPIFGENPDGWRDASPLLHVAAGKDIPPFLICYSRGMGPRLNPARRKQAQAFARALRAAGIPAEIVDASDRSHKEINAWFGKPGDTLTKSALSFLANPGREKR